MSRSNNLPTSGVRWGVSLEVDDEARLGAMLGFASIIGAKNVGWQPLGRPATPLPAPAPVREARGAPQRRKKKMNRGEGKRIAEAILGSMAPGGQFSVKELTRHLGKSAYGVVHKWTTSGLVEKLGGGRYRKLSSAAEAA